MRVQLDDLICIRDHGVDCERRRPWVLAMGQDVLHHLHKMNTIFLDSGDVEDTTFSSPDGSLVFVHEKRMGFGIHPNSMIAQEFSEVITHLLRQDIDAIEDPLMEGDSSHAMQQWLEMRRAVEPPCCGLE